MKRTMKDIKGCGQLPSIDTLFVFIWFNILKILEEANAKVVEYCGPLKTSHRGFFLSKLKN